MSKIRYPIFKIKGNPTPNDRLMICECGRAEWTVHSNLSYIYHSCADGKRRRMVEANEEEYTAGKVALITII